MALVGGVVTRRPGDGGSREAYADGWQVTIDGIAAGGDGVGRLADGRVAFVPRTAPGDRVRVRPVRDGGRWVRAEVDEVLERSPNWRPPPCPLQDRCGGCPIQQLDEAAQLEAASRIVGDALRRIGGVDVADPPVRAAERPFGYRNRVTYTLKRLRSGRVVAGFHRRDRAGHIIDVHDECLLPEPPIADVWPRLRAGWGAGASLLPGGGELRLTLRAVDEGVLVAVEGGRPGWQAAPLLEATPGVAAVWHRAGGAEAWEWKAGLPVCHDVVGGERIGVRPGAFTQVNRDGAAALHAAVRATIGDPAGRVIVDAYCGVGIHGRGLARAGAHVTGIEVEPAAVQAARAQAPPGFRVVEGRVEDTLARVLPTEAVILNPPRTGLHAAVPEILRASPPETLVYVSCDPATLARDLKRLGDGWRVDHVAAFDLFPQTAHIETVVTMRRDTARTDG